MSAVAEAFPTSRVPVVNVATVPQRSPLRYPGGKTWLIPHIREWLRHTKPKILIEPFAGGGVVSLTAVMEDLVSAAIMVEIDPDVAAFWHSALASGTTLQEWIGQFEPTIERLREIEQVPPATAVDRPFFEAIGGSSAFPSYDLNDGDIVWLVPRVTKKYRLKAHHWEVLSLEESSRKLLSAETVKRQEFESALRAKLKRIEGGLT